jgi:hypothetical protein
MPRLATTRIELASGGLTIWYTRAGARNLRIWAIIGLLLLFGLA